MLETVIVGLLETLLVVVQAADALIIPVIVSFVPATTTGEGFYTETAPRGRTAQIQQDKVSLYE
jgi:hypothetical protein